MDREVDQALAKIAKERAELEKELEALSNDLKAAYAKAAVTGRGTVAPAPAAEVPASAAGNDATAADVAAAATVDHDVGNSMDVAEEEEGGGKLEKAVAGTATAATVAGAAVGAEETSR